MSPDRQFGTHSLTQCSNLQSFFLAASMFRYLIRHYRNRRVSRGDNRRWLRRRGARIEACCHRRDLEGSLARYSTQFPSRIYYRPFDRFLHFFLGWLFVLRLSMPTLVRETFVPRDCSFVVEGPKIAAAGSCQIGSTHSSFPTDLFFRGQLEICCSKSTASNLCISRSTAWCRETFQSVVICLLFSMFFSLPTVFLLTSRSQFTSLEVV